MAGQTTADRVLDVLGEPNRRRLLRILHERSEASVSDLVDASGLRQPQVSKHLKALASAALVTARTDGRHRRYRLDDRGLRTAHDWFASFEDVWQSRFDALDSLVSTPDHPHDPQPDERETR